MTPLQKKIEEILEATLSQLEALKVIDGDESGEIDAIRKIIYSSLGSMCMNSLSTMTSFCDIMSRGLLIEIERQRTLDDARRN
jgi:hypothetical protein